MKTLTQTPGQVLQTPRLVLRPWREDDAEALYELARNPEIGPRAGWPVHTDVENSLQIIRGVLSAPETYAIVVIESGELVGSIGLLIGSASNLGLPADEAEVGYWVGQPFWGRGYAPEATRELMRRAFDDLGITTMWCGYFEGNDKSRRVGQKCGFGHRRAEEKHWPLIDRTVVQHITAITKQEYQNI